MGHLGNQMFQYAALRGIADNLGYSWCIPPEYIFGIGYPMRSSIYNVFSMRSVGVRNTLLKDLPVLYERHFHFDQELFDLCPDNVDINGYFQSYRYFQNVDSLLREDFELSGHDGCKMQKRVSIHVRRGDYVGQPEFHPIMTAEYYEQAMSYFNNYEFIVISDDPDWCSSQPVFEGCKIFNTGNLSEDFCAMINSEHNIIANSSFSWWGAWLNRNSDKVVVAPKTWFGSAYQHDTSDLIPEDWRLI